MANKKANGSQNTIQIEVDFSVVEMIQRYPDMMLMLLNSWGFHQAAAIISHLRSRVKHDTPSDTTRAPIDGNIKEKIAETL